MKLRHIFIAVFALTVAPASAAIVYTHPLLVMAAQTSTVTGSGVVLLSKENACAGRMYVTAASGTNPTLDVTIQYSVDNAVWFNLVSFTQVTSAPNNQVVHYDKELTRQYPWTRAVATIGGTTPSFTGTVYLDCES